MAKLFVVQDRYDEEITKWHIFSNETKADAKYKELEAEYEEDWQVKLETVSGSNCGFLIGFDDDAGTVFAEPVKDIKGYELNTSWYSNTTAHLIGPKTKEGKIIVGPYGDLDLKGNLEDLAYWQNSEIQEDNIPANKPVKAKSKKPERYDEVLKVVNVMRAEWEKVKPEDKGANSIEGLPQHNYRGMTLTLPDFQAKHIWFGNILNDAVFKCNLNPIYSNTPGFKILKKAKNVLIWNNTFMGLDSFGEGIYFEWPENITKESNKIVSAAGKDQEIMIKALYVFIRDYMNELPESETTGYAFNDTGQRRLLDIWDWDRWITAFAEGILSEIDDPDVKKSRSKNRYGTNYDWASNFSAFESVQPVNQLKHVQLFEGFVNDLNKKS